MTDEPVQPRLPAAGAAEPGREPLLGHLPQDPDSWRGRWTTCPRSWKAWTPCCRDTYFCNFSIFQSMPDSWAIKQLFPIMPIHRLNERPTRRAVLGDITCDSDGKIDQFIDRRDVKRTLPAAPFRRPALLPGSVPAGGLPGDPRRPAQPLRRHQRRARQHGRRRRRDRRDGHQGRHGPRGAGLRGVRRRRADAPAAARPSRRRCARTRIDDQQAGRLLRFYEDGLQGYTYLEEGHEK